jgi:hypothetical protein
MGIDYFGYQAERQQRKDAPRPKAASAPQPPAAPIKVEEFDGASTTIVRRIRHALAEKFRGG